MGQTAKIGTQNPWLELRTDPAAVPVEQALAQDDMQVDDDELNFADDWYVPQQNAMPMATHSALQHDPWAVPVH